MRKALIAAIAVVLLGSVGYAAGIGRSDVDCATYEFPSAMWKQTGATADESKAAVKARRRAVAALRKCDLLERMTKRQVTQLLGRHYREPDVPNTWGWTIGPGRGPFAVDYDILHVFFKGGRVSRVSIGQG